MLSDGSSTCNCMLQQCPDYIKGECKPHGVLKVFPQFDLATSPYKFETQSEIAIKQIEAMLSRIWNLLKTSHAIRCRNGEQVQFDGMLGTQWFLRVKSVQTSKGSAFVVELVPSKSLNSYIMTPIKAELERVQKLQLEGKAASIIDSQQAAAAIASESAAVAIEYDASQGGGIEAEISDEDIGDESAPAEVISESVLTADEFAKAAGAFLDK